jgi:prefoldin subunit 5
VSQLVKLSDQLNEALAQFRAAKAAAQVHGQAADDAERLVPAGAR